MEEETQLDDPMVGTKDPYLLACSLLGRSVGLGGLRVDFNYTVQELQMTCCICLTVCQVDSVVKQA